MKASSSKSAKNNRSNGSLKRKNPDPLDIVQEPIDLYQLKTSQAHITQSSLMQSLALESLEDIISYSPEDDDTRSSLPTDTKEEYKVREVFIQKENCFMTHQSLPQCCECEKDPLTNKFACRFFEFRKIERNNGFFKAVGFLDPFIDPTAQDLKLWTEYEERLITDRESADYILACIASQFCEMSQQELKISKNESTIAWKRSVQEVREICDVCETSLFNCHMTCKNCGTIVCIDCFEERESGIVRWKPKTKADKRERDSFFWLKCPKSENHDLLLTQITTGNALLFLNQNIHKVCSCRDISQTCECLLGTKDGLLTRSKKLLKDATDNEQKTEDELRKQMKSRHRKKSPLIRNLGFAELNQIYLNVEHVLTSQGRIVKIVEPSESTECYRLFQNQWEKGKPVIVANATKNLRQYTWSPVYFSQRFGAEKHVMIDCHNGNAINRVAMKYFWDGFSSVKKRLPLDCSEKCVLKLKDWPTSDDFANVMKSHFDDFMNAVPLSEYTSRNGKFNLARYLPEHFSRPDLGPKMYSAYAQNHPSTQGSTNLHLDVSDAVNIMVHVSRPADSHLAPKQYSISSIHEALVAAGADEIDKKNLLSGEKLPGAIWHIFPADKANEIRRLLRENSREYKRALGVNDDPIHDQDWYIDGNLRTRLKAKGVDSYTIVQYEGDAVFIPAGAPHQVLNILDCIKVALDFVAPENLSECLNLTEEFRILSTRHQNREDRLQVKNILYHTVKNLVPAQSTQIEI